jgi:hypothetical protein
VNIINFYGELLNKKRKSWKMRKNPLLEIYRPQKMGRYLFPSQIAYLTKLRIKGYLFYDSSNATQCIKERVRRLQAQGESIRFIRIKLGGYKGRVTDIKCRTCIVFYIGKEEIVYKEILKRWPILMRRPKGIQIMIFKNTHKQATEITIRKLHRHNKLSNSKYRKLKVHGV